MFHFNACYLRLFCRISLQRKLFMGFRKAYEYERSIQLIEYCIIVSCLSNVYETKHTSVFLKFLKWTEFILYIRIAIYVSQ